MKEIQLTQGKVALVDDRDFERLNRYKWCAMKDGKTFYATRNSLIVNGKKRTIWMHRAILGKPQKGFDTDHINGYGLDNRRKNLRHVTRRQNLQNMKNVNKSSKYPGVSWCKTNKKWQTLIKINGKQKHLGRFTDEREAFEVYKQAVNDIGEAIL